jgi:hypothetical protein
VTIVVAVDPGKTGAIAILDDAGGIRFVGDLPVLDNPKHGEHMDVPALKDLVLRHVMVGEAAISVMEYWAPFGKSLLSCCALEANRAEVRTVLKRFPMAHVSPRDWQSLYGLYGREGDKHESLRLARGFWPACTALARVKDHNRAEALLIARFAQRTMT